MGVIENFRRCHARGVAKGVGSTFNKIVEEFEMARFIAKPIANESSHCAKNVPSNYAIIDGHALRSPEFRARHTHSDQNYDVNASVGGTPADG